MPTKRATASHPAGVILTAESSGRVIEADTLQCVHCGMHWQVIRGSGKERGWCTRCNGPTCGENKQCMVMCYPVQKQFDDQEKHGGLILP